MDTQPNLSVAKPTHMLQNPAATRPLSPVKTILIVDDNPDDLLILRHALAPVLKSCRFLTATDGIEAQTLLQSLSPANSDCLPAAIFTDINMPRQNGFGLVAWLKAQPQYASIPVVMVSTFDRPGEQEKAMIRGASACLTKPPDPEKTRNVVVPLLRPDVLEQPAQTTDRRRCKRILLADDDAGIRETLGRVLESEHYEVVFAKNGQEAATKSVSSEPDMVLLDLNMPDRDGWSAFRFMEAARPLLPVIVITARPNQYQQADQLGVDALMEKPLDLHILLQAIENLLHEPERDRTRRITNPGFKTALLTHCSQSGQPMRNV